MTDTLYIPPSSSSDGLLQTDAALSATPQIVKDNLGNSSVLEIATDEVVINGDLAVNGDYIAINSTDAIDMSCTFLTISGNISATNLVGTNYVPTLTNTLNITSSSAHPLTVSRVGTTVTIGGHIDIKAAGVGTTTINISLPIASNFSTIYQVGGTAAALTGTGVIVGIFQANTTSDTITLTYLATDTATRVFSFTCQYEII